MAEVDVQQMQATVQWAVNGVTILLMIIAGAIATKKNKNVILLVAIIGNLAAYYFTRSPLIGMIISIACIIWASMSKAVPQGKSKIEDEDADDEEDEEVEEVQEKKSKEKMIKCRFCKKKYGSDYNGCPYCKKV